MENSLSSDNERRYPGVNAYARDSHDYEYREYPKHLGFDKNGDDVKVFDEHDEKMRAHEVIGALKAVVSAVVPNFAPKK